MQRDVSITPLRFGGVATCSAPTMPERGRQSPAMCFSTHPATQRSFPVARRHDAPSLRDRGISPVTPAALVIFVVARDDHLIRQASVERIRVVCGVLHAPGDKGQARLGDFQLARVPHNHALRYMTLGIVTLRLCRMSSVLGRTREALVHLDKIAEQRIVDRDTKYIPGALSLRAQSPKLGNRLMRLGPTALPAGASVCRRQRLGGTLSFYYRVAP